jgi:hypothetical protein
MSRRADLRFRPFDAFHLSSPYSSKSDAGFERMMWWTVVKEAAANWSSHKDARQEPRSHTIRCFRSDRSS